MSMTPEPVWLDAFVRVFERCRISAEESVIVLAERGSRAVLIELTELALTSLGHSYYRLVLPSPLSLIHI